MTVTSINEAPTRREQLLALSILLDAGIAIETACDLIDLGCDVPTATLLAGLAAAS